MNGKVTRIADLRPGMSGVTVVGRIVKKWEVPASVRLARAILDDGTGTIELNLWRDQVDQAEVGDVIKVRNAYVKTFGGKPRLNTWRRIEIIERKGKSPD